MRKYPHDTFDVVPKGKTGELRLKCFDCPGMSYFATLYLSTHNNTGFRLQGNYIKLDPVKH